MPDQPQTKSELFDFALVLSDEELDRQKSLALNLQGLAGKFVATIDEMRHKKKRYEIRQKETVR